MENKKKHILGLDLVRVVAVILVLTVHFFLHTKYYDSPLTGINMNIQSVIKNFCLSCVPLFILLTGFLNNKKEYNKKFFKGLAAIIIIWLFYCIIEFFVLNIINDNYENLNINNFIYSITSFQAVSYSWYIEMYIGLYLLAPLINVAFDNFSNSNKKIFTAIIFFLGIGFNFLNIIFKDVIQFPDFWNSIYILSYYVVGKYIATIKPKFSKKYLFLLLVINQLLTFYYQSLDGISVDYNSLTIFTQSVILFLLIYDINIKNDI